MTGEQTDEAIIISKIELFEPQHGRSSSVGTGQLSERGSGYVFVTALPIANPDFPGLEELLGQSVELTGERTDDAIVVSKIELSQ